MMYLLNGLPAFAGTFIVTGNIVTSGSVTASYFTVTGGTAATCLNGIYQATANSCEVASNGVRAVLFDSSQNAIFAGQISVGTIFGIGWFNRGYISASADGVFLMRNNALSDFARLQFGGTTASFPALKRSGVNIEAVLADSSAFTSLVALNHISNGPAVVTGAGNIAYGGTTATTVGAAGGATALPATPLGYIIVNVAGTTAKIPYYNN